MKKSFTLEGNIIDLVQKRIFKGQLLIVDSTIQSIKEMPTDSEVFIVAAWVNAHVHIESSMLPPSEFAKIAVRHGTVASVSDPHEIANVLGMEGIHFMIDNSKTVPFKFFFGVPSCVPATEFETAGHQINVQEIEQLLQNPDIHYLSEMMNFPAVISNDATVMEKIRLAHHYGKKIDGHAPNLSGKDLQTYVNAGISTDHECTSLEEALEKINLGMTILIREGSAAKNFATLYPLIDSHPDKVMLCTDDSHPDDLVQGHLNSLIKRALNKGLNLFNILRTLTINPVEHYQLPVGLLREGDPADCLIIDNLKDWNVLQTYIDGELVFDNHKTLFESNTTQLINNFHRKPISLESLTLKDKNTLVKVIDAIDGELFTPCLKLSPKVENGEIVADLDRDILKIVVASRYDNSPITVGLIHNFGLKSGAVAQSIAHDSHNLIAVGTSDEALLRAINQVIENQGGIVVVDEVLCYELSLPIAGLMSNEAGEKVALKYELLNKKVKKLGSKLKAPLMTLSFMALLVIPEFKIGDKGLFNGTKFEFTSLYE